MRATIGRRGRVAAVGLTLALSVALPATAQAQTTGVHSVRPGNSATVWRQAAVRALDRADASARTKGSSAAAWANMARASARLFGWRSPRTQDYLARTLALRHRDGGWGINETSDVFADGSVNPASTTYTVTTADHVGQMLVEGYDAGVVPATYLVGARDALWAMARARTAAGTCVAYSSAPADTPTVPGHCVNNANIAAAWFLAEVADRGFERAGQRALVADIVRYDDAQYVPTRGLFRYGSSSGAVQDVDHNGLNVEAHVALGETAAGSVGEQALAAMGRAAPGTNPLDPLGLLRVAALAPQTCSTRAVLADIMIRRVPTLVAHAVFDHPYLPAVRYSQVAVWSARNAVDCTSTLVPRPARRPL